MFLDSSPQRDDKQTFWQRTRAIAIYLLFWLILTLTGLWLMFESRETLVEVMIYANLNPWAVRGIDRLAIFVLGIGWFVGLMWIDHYLRTGIAKKRLWRNIGRVAAVQLAIAIAAYAIRFLVNL
jgi:hypothetical protein